MIKLYELSRTQEPLPRFSWKLEGDTGQSAYRILVKDSENQTAWDSGWVSGSDRHGICCGKPLAKGERYRWEVNCRGLDGSEASAEGTDFFSPIPQWKAGWIEPDRTRKPLTDRTDMRSHEYGPDADPLETLDPAVYLRRSFRLEKVPSKALAYVSAHGIYAMWINGVCVSDFLAPGFTSYAKRLEYQCYDLSGLLREGENVLGFVLADGWYTGKIGAAGVGQQFGEESALLFQLEYGYADGEKGTLCSDESFRWATGAWRFADLYVGEYYDANLAPKGWLETGFDDENWGVPVLRNDEYENLSLQFLDPVQELYSIQPTVYRTPEGDLLLDAGETIVGYTSFELMLEAGQTISLEHSETVDRNGNFLQNIEGQNKQQKDFYRADVSGIHKWQPMFTFHGFRYVRVCGTEDCDPSHYTIHVMGTPLRQTGHFRCSDERLNRLQDNILRSQRGNMICIPTDCPQREKTGWTGDIQIYAPTACYEMDVEQFLRHWLQDMVHEQLADGQIPHIVPYNPSHDLYKPPGITGVSAAGWSDAAVILPWRLYEAYGNCEILEEFFPMMHRYMCSVEKTTSELPADYDQMEPQRQAYQKYLWNTGFQFGDWLMPNAPGPISAKLTGYPIATLMYAHTADLMQKICQLLHKTELAEHYAALNRKILSAFAAEYVQEDGTITADYQGVYVLALAFGGIPQPLREKAIKRLETLIHQNGDRLDTGFLSVPYLLPVLHENGLEYLANRLLFQDQCPSWLYQVKMGATTMWEAWNAYAPDGTPSMYSMNHYAFGCVGSYLFGTILGLRPEEAGYRRVRIQPDVNCGLSRARGSFDSIWGKICVSWEKADSTVNVEVQLPPDVEGELILGDTSQRLSCGTHSFKICVNQC